MVGPVLRGDFRINYSVSLPCKHELAQVVWVYAGKRSLRDSGRGDALICGLARLR